MVFKDRFIEDPSESGRSAVEVIKTAVKEILPLATLFDHSRCFAFISSSVTWIGVLADIMATAHQVNQFFLVGGERSNSGGTFSVRLESVQRTNARFHQMISTVSNRKYFRACWDRTLRIDSIRSQTTPTRELSVPVQAIR